MGLGKWIG